MSSFCSSNGITLMPNGITAVPAAESSLSRLTKAARKYGGSRSRIPSTRSLVVGGSSPKRSERSTNGHSWASC